MSGMFLVVALVASGFLGLQLLMMIFGADMDFDSDMDVDASDGGGFMSIRSLTAFFGGFGWAGLAAKQSDWSNGAAIGIGVGVGLGFFVVAGFLFMQVRKLDSSGNEDIATTLGQTGTVYLTVPPSRSAKGKVQVRASRRLSIVSALTDAEQPIAANTQVRVIELIDSTTVLVERG